MRRPLRIVLLGAAAALVSACSDGGGDSPTAPPPPPPAPVRDSLAIVSVVPASGSTLASGVSLSVEARLSYRFAQAARGRLSCSIFCSQNRKISCISVGMLAELPAAAGEIVVQVGLKPVGTSANLSFSMVPEGATEATASAAVSYRIE